MSPSASAAARTQEPVLDAGAETADAAKATSAMSAVPAVADPAPVVAGAVTPAQQPATMFAGFMGAEATRRRGNRLRGLTVTASLVAHGALLVVGLVMSIWHVDELSAPRVAVTFISLPVAPPPPPPAARKAEAHRPRPVKPLRQPVAVAPVQPPEPETAEKDEATETNDPAGVAGGTSGGVAGGVVGSLSDGPPPKAPTLSAQERQALIHRYLEQVLRPRVLSHFRFPPEAERLGIEGQVAMQASIDGSGRLLGLSPMGSCPDEVLCEDAARTIRAAAPFPPPPPALADGVRVVFPLTYKLP